jgi:hypothetical protein
MELGPIRARRLDGGERFVDAGRQLDFDVLDYWRWSASDLVSNASRGILAEYLIGRAVGAPLGVREEWAVYDLKSSSGVAIEVKSSAYLQSWHQERLSAITFGCAKRLGWNPITGKQDTVPCRHSDVYVFALLAHQDQATLNPLDVSQWEFYVVPTAWLDARKRSQHSITLPSLRRDFESVTYEGLAAAVEATAAEHRRLRPAAASG